MNLAMLSDSGFGIGGGAELAANLACYVNTEYLGNKVFKMNLSPDTLVSSYGFDKMTRRLPVIRNFSKSELNKIRKYCSRDTKLDSYMLI